MKKHIQFTTLLILIATLFTGCEVVEGIFDFGMGVGIFIAVVVGAVILFIISRFSSKD